MEHAQIQTSEGTPVMINGQQIQVLQMNNSGGHHMVQGPNGQQIVVHTIPATAPTIQMAAPNGQQLQQVQVVPLSSLQGASTNLQPVQLVQTADGQTFLYQPTSNTAHSAIETPQIIHQPTMINLNGNLVQVAGAVQPQQIVNQPNIVMMVNGANGATTTGTTNTVCTSATPVQDSNSGGNEEEPLLYVNARQYKRILKRRIARARLHELGKIPKERPKYLHESRHRHAMNRIRGEGGRFHSGSRKSMEEHEHEESNDVKVLPDIKQETLSIKILHDDGTEETNQSNWTRISTLTHQKMHST